MRIGELARATGSKVETVRYYETIGLLGAPTRSASNYRIYDQRQLNRLGFIRRARTLGFSIDEVRQLLDLADDQARPCRAVDDLARAHLDAIDRRIADLETLRVQLNRLLTACPSSVIADCHIIEALGAD